MSTWTKLIDLAALAGRPLVFFDFETSSINGPPCEFALVVIDPREDASVDPETAAAIAGIGASSELACTAHGVCYAVSARCNPLQPIAPGAQAVHGITDADVANLPAYNGPEVLGLFDHFKEAIWCGHNVAGFDLPLAYKHRMLPPGRDFIDTMMMASYFRDKPIPEHYQVLDDCDCAISTPLIAHAGLSVFGRTLSALHYALTGHHIQGAHGALADVIANVRVAQLLLNGWVGEAAMISFMVHNDKAEALAVVLKFLQSAPKGQIGHSGWIKYTDLEGRRHYEIGKGKPGMRGRCPIEAAENDPGLIKWILKLDDLDEETGDFLRAVMRGEIGDRVPAETQPEPMPLFNNHDPCDDDIPF